MNEPWTANHIPSQQGRRVVITGANSGIGFTAAHSPILITAAHPGYANTNLQTSGPGEDNLSMKIMTGPMRSLRRTHARARFPLCSPPYRPRAAGAEGDRPACTSGSEALRLCGFTPSAEGHGLRHSRGVELALAGASDSEIMSQLEHADSRTAQIYRRQAERRQLADSAQAKINESIRRRVARKGGGGR